MFKAYRDFSKDWQRHKGAGTLRYIHFLAISEALRSTPYILASVGIAALVTWLVEKFVLHETLHAWLMHVLRIH